MNPILMQVLQEAEAKGLSLLLESITDVVQDVLAGKDVAAAFQDLAMDLAEKQAKAVDGVLSP